MKMNAGATREFVLMKIRICRLGLAKRDFWGLGAESWFVVARFRFANPNVDIPKHEDVFSRIIQGIS